ncbi:SAF domain-containing protein [Brevibacillus dissolubilis]|uniref:SAF domain-containing protein n=1 Tax=Brevibacillus dissolubilis TaxID=1844116 RepID=UPI0011169846|nr:SAF domain-containing protein [Brevibacillus dissolubilis]
MNINKKVLIPSLILSTGLSLVTLYLGYQQAEQSFQSREYTQVVTVKQGKMIQPYSPIIPSDLDYKEVPKSQVLPGSIIQTDQIIGKVAWMPMGSGETVLDWKLMDGKLLPKKQEARYEIELSEFTPMSEIRRGDFVKVWINYSELDPEKLIELGDPRYFQKTNDTADLLFTSQVVAVKDGSGGGSFFAGTNTSARSRSRCKRHRQQATPIRRTEPSLQNLSWPAPDDA